MKKTVLFTLSIVLAGNLQAELITTKFPSGALKSEIEYRDGTLTKLEIGVKEGIEKVYYVNGNVAYEVKNVDGKRDGEFRWYDEKGPLIKSSFYKMGKFHGPEKTYYTDGTLEHEVNFVDGGKEGVQKDYFSTGKLAIIVTYKGGKKEGVQKRYRDDGTLYSEVTYRHNFKEGKEKVFDKEGKVVHAERHKLDRPIDVMKRVQAKKPDATLEAFKTLNFNPDSHKPR